MDKYLEHKDLSLKHITLADHILTMTYPLVNDPKLLKFVMKNIGVAIENCYLMLLYYERLHRRLPPISSNFESNKVYLEKVFNRYKLSDKYISFIEEIRNINDKQKNSEVEFIRKDNFVFASKTFELDMLSKDKIKDYLIKAKLFINQAVGVIHDGRS